MNAVGYLEFLKRLVDRCMTIENTQCGCSMRTPDFIALPKLLSRLSKGVSNVGFNPLIL